MYIRIRISEFLAGCYCLPLNLRNLFSKVPYWFVLVCSGIRMASFVERCPASFPGTQRASSKQSASQLLKPSRTYKWQGINSYFYVVQMAQSTCILHGIRFTFLLIRNCKWYQGIYFRKFMLIVSRIKMNICNTGL